MELIKPSYEILSQIDGIAILKSLELAGRVCYKSEEKITSLSASNFVRMLINKGHESVLEHEKISVRFICDRGVSHEIVRHRIASFSQESTRYCNYKGGVAFILPFWFTNGDIETMNTQESMWYNFMQIAEATYQQLILAGWTPQQARSVLPNSTKTEIIVTANLREWRTIFKQRTSNAAHPQMREIMIPLMGELVREIPVIFDDIFNEYAGSLSK